MSRSCIKITVECKDVETAQRVMEALKQIADDTARKARGERKPARREAGRKEGG